MKIPDGYIEVTDDLKAGDYYLDDDGEFRGYVVGIDPYDGRPWYTMEDDEGWPFATRGHCYSCDLSAATWVRRLTKAQDLELLSEEWR